MGATYHKNPVTLAAVNPGKPPKAKQAKGGKTVAKAKRKSTKRSKAASAARSAVRKVSAKRKSTGKRKASAKQLANLARGRKIRAQNLAAAKRSAPKASSKRKSARRKSVVRKAAVARKFNRALAAPASAPKAASRRRRKSTRRKSVVRKAAVARAFNRALAAPATPKRRKSTRRKSAARKSSPVRKMPARYTSGPKRGQFKPAAGSAKRSARKSSAKRSVRKSAVRKATPRKATPRKSSARRSPVSRSRRPAGAPRRRADGTFSSTPRLTGAKARPGRMKPGWYPISGYQVSDRWGYRQNPVQVMPNGSILDPRSKKFVSPRSARGRALLRGKGSGLGSWMSNPAGALAEGARDYKATAMVALKQVAGLSAGFFGARMAANYVSMASWTSRLPEFLVPYAPFLAQGLMTGVIFVAGQKIEAVKPYQVPAMAGVGLSMLEAIVNRFMPEAIRDYVAVPDPGLGDSLDVYRRALGADPYAHAGLDEGWYNYHPSDRRMLGEYVLEEDLDPAFDMGEYVLPEDLDEDLDVGVGEYVLNEDLDGEFDIDGGMGDYILTDDLDPDFDAVGGYDDVQRRARAQVGMGEYVTPESLEEDFDIFGGVGSYDTVASRARNQIALGDAGDPIITNVFGSATSAGMFGNGDTAKMQAAIGIATTAIEAAKASGASPQEAARAAAVALRNQAKCSKRQAKAVIAQALRGSMKATAAQVQPAALPVAPAAPELLPEEPDEDDFRQGLFGEGMFDPSDDE